MRLHRGGHCRFECHYRRHTPDDAQPLHGILAPGETGRPVAGVGIHAYGGAGMSGVGRLRDLPLAALTPAQRTVRDQLLSGPRGAIVGPFNVWLRRPELADVADRFGKYCRFGGNLDRSMAELTILQVASHTGARFEWDHHYPYAQQAGLSDAQLHDLAQGRPVTGLEEKAHAAYLAVDEMLRTSNLCLDTYRRVVRVLGEDALIDLVGIVGYYLFVSLTINVFEIGHEPAGAVGG
ncbi:hypothetical protein L506_3630 [Bordetella bronchiseptica GA96-01]|nr:hypothetical protein L572_3637 [Bordetella bronchiseptica 345]KDC37268.1 hypothetical protein L506_3630 [Bordetella bronchiseptica GA96-01]KDD94905.1 hypothetical protein L531_3388 [Bordetella bronchiseptica MO275]